MTYTQHNQRGAMFGLDARIALAIFGGLSIIVGATLFYAITQTKAVRIITEMQELNKSILSYLIDTQQNLPTVGLGAMASPLVSSSASGWNGPYTNAELSGAWLLVYGDGTRGAIGYVTAADWSTTITVAAPACSGVSDCFYWAAKVNLPEDATAVYQAIDEMIDGGDGFHTGNFRMRDTVVGDGVISASIKGPRRLP